MSWPVVLLVQTEEGDTVAVRFPSREAARDWEDQHPYELTVVGVALLVSRTDALDLSR